MSKFTEVFILIMMIGMKGLVQGSCLEYGHSCWGAHGKRSDKQLMENSPSTTLNNMKYPKYPIDNLLPSSSVTNDNHPSKLHKYILLNILLDKNDLDKLEVIQSDIPHLTGALLNADDNGGTGGSNHDNNDDNIDEDWNPNKFKIPLLQKRPTNNLRRQITATEIIQDLRNKNINPYKFLINSAKSIQLPKYVTSGQQSAPYSPHQTAHDYEPNGINAESNVNLEDVNNNVNMSDDFMSNI